MFVYLLKAKAKADVRQSITRPTGFPSIARYLPPSNTYRYAPLERTKRLSVEAMRGILEDASRAAGIAIVREEGEEVYVVEPRAISWTRAARRKGVGVVAETPLFHARIRISTVDSNTDTRERSRSPGARTKESVVDEESVPADAQVSLDWVRGRDRAVVEGFWAFLVRKVGDAVRAA